MERYTEKHYDGNGYYLVCSGNCETLNCGNCDTLDKIVDRLAAYEDTGLEPEEIMQAMNVVKFAVSAFEDFGVDRLRELAQADREGRCVVLPVKPGTPVWSTAFCKVDDDGTEHPTYPWPFDIGMANEWGTEWFLTQGEAEAALRREQE